MIMLGSLVLHRWRRSDWRPSVSRCSVGTRDWCGYGQPGRFRSPMPLLYRAIMAGQIISAIAKGADFLSTKLAEDSLLVDFDTPFSKASLFTIPNDASRSPDWARWEAERRQVQHPQLAD